MQLIDAPDRVEPSVEVMLRSVEEFPTMVHKSRINTGRNARYAALLLGGLLTFGIGCNNDTAEVAPRAASLEVSPTPASGALEPEFADEGELAEEVEGEVEGEEPVSTGEANSEIAKLKGRKKGQALDKHLNDRGFKPSGNRSQDLYARRTRYKDPDRPNRRTTHTIVLQNYEKEDGADAGAIATVTVTTREGPQVDTTVYDFALVAPGGDFENPAEFTADDDGNIIPANSWYSCLKNRILSRCNAPACLTALTVCGGTWAAYLACIAIPCYCYPAALACCTCNCSWWCRSVVGCCSR